MQTSSAIKVLLLAHLAYFIHYGMRDSVSKDFESRLRQTEIFLIELAGDSVLKDWMFNVMTYGNPNKRVALETVKIFVQLHYQFAGFASVFLLLNSRAGGVLSILCGLGCILFYNSDIIFKNLSYQEVGVERRCEGQFCLNLLALSFAFIFSKKALKEKSS